MKKIFLLVCITGIWYAAGVFHVANLMAAAITGAFLFPVMWILSWYLKRGFRLEVSSAKQVMIQNGKGQFLLMAENSGRLPVNLFCTDVYAVYVRERCGIKEKPLQHFAGAVGPGETRTWEIFVQLPRCGLIEIYLRKTRIFDYLRLATNKILKVKGCTAAVFPRTPPAQIYSASPSAKLFSETEQNSSFSFHSEHGEYRQLREYEEGDPAGKIHWKKSAAGNQLWVREYGSEEEFLQFGLDLRGFLEKNADENSAFYELLYSLLAGLLAENCLTAVNWMLKTGERQQFCVHRVEDIDELMWMLYQQEFLFGLGQGGAKEDTAVTAEEELCLDTDLCLYRQGKRIGSFCIPEIRAGIVSVYLQGDER